MAAQRFRPLPAVYVGPSHLRLGPVYVPDLQLYDRADLDGATGGPARRHRQGRLAVGHFDDGITAQRFFGLDERTVDHDRFAAAPGETQTHTGGCALACQPVPLDDAPSSRLLAVPGADALDGGSPRIFRQSHPFLFIGEEHEHEPHIYSLLRTIGVKRGGPIVTPRYDE